MRGLREFAARWSFRNTKYLLRSRICLCHRGWFPHSLAFPERESERVSEVWAKEIECEGKGNLRVSFENSFPHFPREDKKRERTIGKKRKVWNGVFLTIGRYYKKGSSAFSRKAASFTHSFTSSSSLLLLHFFFFFTSSSSLLLLHFFELFPSESERRCCWLEWTGQAKHRRMTAMAVIWWKSSLTWTRSSRRPLYPRRRTPKRRMGGPSLLEGRMGLTLPPRKHTKALWIWTNLAVRRGVCCTQWPPTTQPAPPQSDRGSRGLSSRPWATCFLAICVGMIGRECCSSLLPMWAHNMIFLSGFVGRTMISTSAWGRNSFLARKSISGGVQISLRFGIPKKRKASLSEWATDQNNNIYLAERILFFALTLFLALSFEIAGLIFKILSEAEGLSSSISWTSSEGSSISTTTFVFFSTGADKIIADAVYNIRWILLRVTFNIFKPSTSRWLIVWFLMLSSRRLTIALRSFWACKAENIAHEKEDQPRVDEVKTTNRGNLHERDCSSFASCFELNGPCVSQKKRKKKKEDAKKPRLAVGSGRRGLGLFKSFFSLHAIIYAWRWQVTRRSILRK